MRSAVRSRFAAVVVASTVTFGAHVIGGRREEVFHD